MSDRWNAAIKAAAKAVAAEAEVWESDVAAGAEHDEYPGELLRGLERRILALREADTGDMVLVPRDRIEGLLEYWNGHPNHSAMLNALNHIQEELHAMLAAAKEERNG